MRKSILLLVVFSVASLNLTAPQAWGHGVVGDYVFLEPLITQDPTPANELDLMPAWVKDSSANNYSISWSI